MVRGIGLWTPNMRMVLCKISRYLEGALRAQYDRLGRILINIPRFYIIIPRV